MNDNSEFTEKDIKFVKVNGKYGYQYPDGLWFAEPEFDMAYPFEDGFAKIIKDDLEGWISFEEGSSYCPWSQQERWLRENRRKRKRKNKILKLFGLGPKPMELSWWDEEDHCWIVNKFHTGWERFKDNPVIPVTIIFGTAVLIYTFFFQ